MPHIIAKPFDLGKIQGCDFFATDEKNGSDHLINAGDFLLELKRRDDRWLLKPEKITRPAEVEKIKDTLREYASLWDLDIVQENVEAKKRKKRSEYLKDIGFFEDPAVFGQKDCNIEVGFGSGRHLLHRAKESPQELFIGIEVHTPSINQLLRQLELQNITNVWVLNYDARLFMEFVPSNICNKIYVHFPVPWDKKPHRRVISTAFVEQSMRILKRGGFLELRTDSDNYFHYSVETFLAQKSCELSIRKNRDIDISSKYEDRWKKQQKDIYDLHLTALEKSAPLRQEYDFSFPGEVAPVRDGMSATFEDFFLHFDRVYRIDGGGYVQKVTFGSFDKPESRYILIEEGGARYMYADPVKTEANAKAHQKIAEIMCHG